ncbi:hypothetical protein B0H13DRAFT_1869554 [Mycena leptocephala]|nr:hypothetical protein B0H13DRAFT_1869554 [Mycena leptocephala]
MSWCKDTSEVCPAYTGLAEWPGRENQQSRSRSASSWMMTDRPHGSPLPSSAHVKARQGASGIRKILLLESVRIWQIYLAALQIRHWTVVFLVLYETFYRGGIQHEPKGETQTRREVPAAMELSKHDVKSSKVHGTKSKRGFTGSEGSALSSFLPPLSVPVPHRESGSALHLHPTSLRISKGNMTGQIVAYDHHAESKSVLGPQLATSRISLCSYADGEVHCQQLRLSAVRNFNNLRRGSATPPIFYINSLAGSGYPLLVFPTAFPAGIFCLGGENFPHTPVLHWRSGPTGF